MIDENKFNFPKEHKNYLIPQILTNVNHDMGFMTEETFGLCVGIMKVKNEEEAIKLMNDLYFHMDKWYRNCRKNW